MILNKEDALYAADVFVDYFSNMNRIDDYLRKVKLERMSNYPVSLPGMGLEDDMFCDFSMSPKDMDFECREVDSLLFSRYLEITSSHANESSIPGKCVGGLYMKRIQERLLDLFVWVHRQLIQNLEMYF